MESLPHLDFATNRLRYALAVAALAVVYIVAARAGLMMDAVAGFATLVGGDGLSLAHFLNFGLGSPRRTIGAFVANLAPARRSRCGGN